MGTCASSEDGHTCVFFLLLLLFRFPPREHALGISWLRYGVTVSHSMKSLRNAIITSPNSLFSEMKCEQITGKRGVQRMNGCSQT